MGCAPIVHDMPDKRAYDELKEEYDLEKGFTSDEQYSSLDRKFNAFSNDYEGSSYRDNADYYHGRLFQEWAETKTGNEKNEKYEKALEIFRKINDKSSYLDEALYRIAETLDELHKNGDDIDLEFLISSYDGVVQISPKSTNGIKAAKRLKELQQ